MVLEGKIYIDILEQQSLLKCQASSDTWGNCTEHAKFSFFSGILRKTVFLCAKHLTWILEEPEQLISAEHLKDHETIGKKKAAFLRKDPECSNRPCMAVHAAGRRRGRVCGHLNTFCFYSFMLKDYIYLCRRHFLWIDGQIAHEVSFVKLPTWDGQDEESTNSSMNFMGNLPQDISCMAFAEVIFNTSPVTPTRRKENDSFGMTDVSDSQSFLAESETCISGKGGNRTISEKSTQREIETAQDGRCSGEQTKSFSDMNGRADDKLGIAELKHPKVSSRLRAIDQYYSSEGFPFRCASDTNIIERNGSEDKSEEKSLNEEQSCPLSLVQEPFPTDNTGDEVKVGQLRKNLRKHVSGKLKSLQLNSESISRLLLHRGRPRSPTIDEHSTTSLPTHLQKEVLQGNEKVSINKPNILSIPLTAEMKTVTEQKDLDRVILEQSEESSAVSEKEDPSSLNVAAHIVLDSNTSQIDNDRRVDPSALHSMSGHDVTLTTQLSETKFSTTEEVHIDNTIPNSYTTPAGSLNLERQQHDNACCCTIC